MYVWYFSMCILHTQASLYISQTVFVAAAAVVVATVAALRLRITAMSLDLVAHLLTLSTICIVSCVIFTAYSFTSSPSVCVCVCVCLLWQLWCKHIGLFIWSMMMPYMRVCVLSILFYLFLHTFHFSSALVFQFDARILHFPWTRRMIISKMLTSHTHTHTHTSGIFAFGHIHLLTLSLTRLNCKPMSSSHSRSISLSILFLSFFSYFKKKIVLLVFDAFYFSTQLLKIKRDTHLHTWTHTHIYV